MKSWRRVRDIVLEVLVALGLVIGGIVYVASHPGNRLNWGWIGLGGNTAVVFGFLIAWCRTAWKRLAFWITLTGLFVGHTAAYLFVLHRIKEWPLALYVVLNAVELVLFMSIFRKLLMKTNIPPRREDG